jgi:hypothetical protein
MAFHELQNQRTESGAGWESNPRFQDGGL